MSLCSGGFPWNDFFEDTNDAYYTLSFNTSPIQFYSKAKPAGNFLSGYYSDKASCNKVPGAMPGEWRSISEWVTSCHGPGIKRQLTMIELFGNACGNNAQAFCNSLTDQGGNPRKPIVCGGSDPNQFNYNPTSIGTGEVQDQLNELQQSADDLANEIVATTRKKIFAAGLILFLIIALAYLIFS